MDIGRTRLEGLLIDRPAADGPAAVVRRLGAVQAQDYLAGLWAVGLRSRGATEADVEGAIADGRVVRSWPMRGTIHFVPAEDLRWMLRLCASRVIARSAPRYRSLELDARTFARSEKAIVSALEGGKQLTRPALYRVLAEHGIAAAGSRGLHILGHLAQSQVICFGARAGKQPTFALMHEWVRGDRRLERDDALAELARRYFGSHGPATVHDFAWWSGLKVADAKAGIEGASAALEPGVVNGRTLWWSSDRAGTVRETPSRIRRGRSQPSVHLLPFYDEFTVAYRDRSDVLDPVHAGRVGRGGILNPVVVVEGRVVGIWKRELRKADVLISLDLFRALDKKERERVAEAAERYGAFLGRPATLA